MATSQDSRSIARPGAGDAAPGPPPPGPLPLFYRDPRPLSAARHAGLSLARDGGYGFARTANLLPLNAVEFALAARSYPIVFTPEDPPAAVAVLGLCRGRNPFVGPDGAWAPGHYVPGYARRYPFILMTEPTRAQYLLCVDEASGRVVEGAENPFFAEGAPTEVTESAMRFCAAYQAHHDATQAFAAALVEHDLLEPHRIALRSAAGDAQTLAGFRVIVESRLDALADADFLAFRERGWLAPVYHHLQSAANWSALAARAGATRTRPDG